MLCQSKLEQPLIISASIVCDSKLYLVNCTCKQAAMLHTDSDRGPDDVTLKSNQIMLKTVMFHDNMQITINYS